MSTHKITTDDEDEAEEGRKLPSPQVIEERIEEAEELLCAGISPSRIERKLSEKYDLSPRQVRKYITRVYDRWERQAITDAPNRREKVIHMAERFYAKALAEKQYAAASNALNLLAKMSGAFTPTDPQKTAALALLGPAPDDPTQGLIYAQKVMLHALSEIVSNSAIDPERRLRWISEIGGKIGMTHAKALMQHKLEEVATRVYSTKPDDAAAEEMEDANGIQWPDTSRFGGSDSGGGPVHEPDAGPETPEDA